MNNNNKILRDYQLQIKIDGDTQGEEGIKEVYKDQKSALDKVIDFVGKLYITYAVNGLIKVTAREKSNITNKSEKLLIDLGKNLSTQEKKVVSDLLCVGYQDTYYKNAYVYELGGMKINFKIERQEFIDAIVNKKFKGEDFSSRIWNNKADLIDSLHQEILNNLRGKTPIDKAVKNIQERFNSTAYESQRLFITELARVQTEGHDAIAREAGIKRQLYDAVLDNKTSKICVSRDGTIWDIDDPRKPMIPAHPNCRSCWIDLTDSWKFTKKLDSETKELIDYKKYNDWLKDKGINY